MSANANIWKALAAPFPQGCEKSKPIGRGQSARYITARSVMNRLDEVLGPENWTAEYSAFGPSNSVQCRLTVLLPNGDKATKCDVGAGAGMDDDGEDDKSAVSDALKRAAVQLGIGRYLYGEGVPRCYGGGEEPAACLTNVNGRRVEADAPAPPPAPEPAAGERRDPRDGKELFGFAKDSSSIDWFARLGKSWGFPAKILSWSPDQVAQAMHEYYAKRPVLNGHRR